MKEDISHRNRYVRFGSEADICNAIGHVRFTPESGHCSIVLVAVGRYR